MTVRIVTRSLPATDTRGTRVRARYGNHTLTRPWRHELSVRQNHEAVWRALAEDLGFSGAWAPAEDERGYTWVRILEPVLVEGSSSGRG